MECADCKHLIIDKEKNVNYCDRYPKSIHQDKDGHCLNKEILNMKTQAELKALKDNWLSDPCWDIEDTEDFEEYKEELLKFRKEHEQEWEARRYNRLLIKSEALGIRGNIKLADCIEQLENRIKSLEYNLTTTDGE